MYCERGSNTAGMAKRKCGGKKPPVPLLPILLTLGDLLPSHGGIRVYDIKG